MIDVKKDPRYAHIPNKYKNGDCYKSGIDYMLGHQKGHKLCHGWVDGKGPTAGVRFSHCWVEKGDTVIDPSIDRKKPLILPKIVYYAIGNIVEDRVLKYSTKEMFDWLEKTGKAGPWETKYDE